MAQEKFFRFDTDGFPIEMDPDLDDATFNSLTVDSGIAMGSSQLTGLADGTAPDHAVNLGQLDAVSNGLTYKAPARVATVGADLGATFAAGGGANGNGQLTGAPSALDGVTLVAGDRVLVKDQTAGLENGIYVVTATTTTWDRADDADEDAEVTEGMTVWVGEGTVNMDTRWTQTTNDPVTVNTTAQVFVQTSGATLFSGGDGIDITGGVISVDLATDPGLEFATGELRVLVNPAGAIERVAAGLGIILEATDPSLQIAANELGVKFAALTSGLAKNATGLQVVVDNTTIQINGSGQLEVIGGGTVDQYTLTAGAGGVAIGDPIFVSANDTGLPCDNTNNNSRRYAGVAAATAAAAASFAVQQEGVITPASIAGSPAAGDIVWLNTPSGLTVNIPTGSGTHRLVIGKMKNATEVIIEPQYIAKLD